MAQLPLLVVVDDDEGLRLLLVDAIESSPLASSFELQEHASAKPALDAIVHAAAASRRALVLCDNRMPGMTGAELLERARAAPGGEALTLVLMSSAEPPADVRARLAAIGASSFARPFGLKELRAMVADVLGPWISGSGS